MQGQLLNFLPRKNIGYISGDDGKYYRFARKEWKENTIPQNGDRMDFDVNAAGEAVAVFFALNQLQDLYGQEEKDVMETICPKLQAYYETESRYNILDWFLKVLRGYLNFSGRARRREYWYFQLCFWILFLVFLFLESLFPFIKIFCYIYILIMFLPMLAVKMRRLHDVNRSGWWVGVLFFIYFIEIVAILIMISDQRELGVSYATPLDLLLYFIFVFITMGGMGLDILLLAWHLCDTKYESNQWGPPAKPCPS